MKKKNSEIRLAWLLGTLLILMGVSIAYAHHGPIEITIDEAAKKQAPVVFPHGKHSADLVDSCDTCHHMNKGLHADSDLSGVKPCSECHLDPKGDDTPSMREMSPKKNPFHIVCVGCHKAEKKGPTRCTDCHKKK